MIKLNGAMTALVTPLKNGKIDEVSYERLIKRQIANGIDVVVPAGTTGESATMTHEEHRQCIEIAVSVCKGTKTKVLAGAGSNATHESVSLAQFAQGAGAEGILVVTPYYNKPTQEGLYRHYKEIASAVDCGIVLYNVPGRTGVDLQTSTMKRLANEFSHIYAVKEASGSLSRCVEIASEIEGFYVISGDDAINYPIMANGGVGTISVTSNILPQAIANLVHYVFDGDYEASRTINTDLAEMNKVLFTESNPIPIKAIMYIAGIIDHLEYRLPLCEPSHETMKKLEMVLKNIEAKGYLCK